MIKSDIWTKAVGELLCTLRNLRHTHWDTTDYTGYHISYKRQTQCTEKMLCQLVQLIKNKAALKCSILENIKISLGAYFNYGPRCTALPLARWLQQSFFIQVTMMSSGAGLIGQLAAGVFSSKWDRTNRITARQNLLWIIKTIKKLNGGRERNEREPGGRREKERQKEREMERQRQR